MRWTLEMQIHERRIEDKKIKSIFIFLRAGGFQELTPRQKAERKSAWLSSE